jgi:hypothetical protein
MAMCYGTSSYCRPCAAERSKKAYHENPELKRAKHQEWIESNQRKWANESPYDNPELKECRDCNLMLERKDFYARRDEADGLGGRCRKCEAKYQGSLLHRDPRISLLRGAKSRAQNMDLPFDITREDIVLPDTCPILGIKLQKNRDKLEDSSYTLDRTIPSLGYVKGNIAVVSHRANTLKSNSTVEEMKMLLKYLESLPHAH